MGEFSEISLENACRILKDGEIPLAKTIERKFEVYEFLRQGIPQKDIAKMIGVASSRVHQIIRAFEYDIQNGLLKPPLGWKGLIRSEHKASQPTTQ